MNSELSRLSVDELIDRFQIEYVKYWRLANSLSHKESKKSSGRLDLDQLDICFHITDELQSRSPEDVLKLKKLLGDARPEVRLEAARALEGFDFDATLQVLRELATRNLGADGYADPYGIQARLALDRHISAGKALTEADPEDAG